MNNYAQDAIDAVTSEQPTLPDELARLYALLVLVKGTDTTMEDVHDAWSVWTTPADPEHRCLVPYSELAVDVQDLDGPFQQAIHDAVGHLTVGPPAPVGPHGEERA